MKIFHTQNLTPADLGSGKSATERLWVYNGLDNCVTLEVFQAIHPQLDNLTASTYAFSRDLQGPVLDINTVGIKVDFAARDAALDYYSKQRAQLETQLEEICREGLGLAGFNPRSPDQVKHLFYKIMGIPEVKYQGKVTTRRDALEKIARNYMLAEPLVSHILWIKDIGKKIGVLKTGIDSDGRIRTSINIAGTNTGRFSSSFSEFEEGGTNLQNIEEILRRIFIADPGYKFAYIDLEQAESRALGAICWNRFGASAYLDACESGDLHTSVAKLSFKGLAWTGDLAKDKEIAEQPFYRQHSYRHMSKVLGHGTNYFGQPPQMAIHTKIPSKVITEFQQGYFQAFPEIPAWHEDVRNRLYVDGYLISLMGRKRHFFGRRNEEETIRGAIAFDPQGSVGDILNSGMLRVWQSKLSQLLLQVHDAILVQYPEEREDEILPHLLELIKHPVPLERGRTLVIPSEAKVGWNWGNQVNPITKELDNPDGLKKYKGHDDRQCLGRPQASILDRRVY